MIGNLEGLQYRGRHPGPPPPATCVVVVSSDESDGFSYLISSEEAIESRDKRVFENCVTFVTFPGGILENLL